MDPLSPLDIPEDNREIALHLRAIRSEIYGLGLRLDKVESEIGTLDNNVTDRRFKMQDIFVSALLLPMVGGILMFLLTKALG